MVLLLLVGMFVLGAAGGVFGSILPEVIRKREPVKVLICLWVVIGVSVGGSAILNFAIQNL